MRSQGVGLLGAIVMTTVLSIADASEWSTPGSPKLMGVYIGGPDHYDEAGYQKQLSRFDVLVLNFWPEWKEWKYGPTATRDVLRAIKTHNPGIHIGQYTNLNEAKAAGNTDTTSIDLAQKLDREGWWLRDADGRQVQWTDRYQAFDINVTAWTRPDRTNLRYPQWFAERNYRVFFRANPEFDFWYLDNSLSAPAVKQADWKGNGKNDDGRHPAITEAHRLGHFGYWQRIRKLQPGTLLIGNADDLSSPEYSGRLNGAFLEALIGESWSTETRNGWSAMMARYHGTMDRVAAPKVVGFGVIGEADDYQRLRYGLTSCLLNDGYFSYSNDRPSYASVIWFDEYDLDLGNAIDPPATEPWRNGVYRRRFEKGLVLVNPGVFPVQIEVEPGYRKFKGQQDPDVNDGEPATVLRLAGRDGIVVLKEPGR